MVFGTFDGIHPGHNYLLTQAASMGNLIVIVARDTTVLKVKGRLPVYNETKRLTEIKKHPAVTEATLGNTGPNKTDIISSFMPDIICLGYDQRTFVDDLKNKLSEKNLDIDIKRIDSYKPHLYKSSKLNKK